MDLRPTTLESPLDRKTRAFLGSGPPPEEWLSAWEAWSVPLQRRVSQSIRWTPPDNFHVTLRFFGDISQSEIMLVEEIVAVVARDTQPFTIRADGLRIFPDRYRPRVLALGLRDEPVLLRLEETIRRATRSIGQKSEDQQFHPHLTVARAHNPTRRDVKLLQDLLDTRAEPNLPAWQVADVTLFQSVLGAGGPKYKVLKAAPLTGVN